MGIDLVWRDARGKRQDFVPDSTSTLSTAIQRMRDDRRELLISTIDPYGNTTFSSGQAPQLLREFTALRSESNDPAERIVIGRVISVLRAAEGIQDQWLEFVGD